MTFNTMRAARMREMSEGALIKRVHDRTLSSAAAAYELRRRGVQYVVRPMTAEDHRLERRNQRRSE